MSDQLFERAVHGWLEDGSDRTPPAAIDAVLLAVKTTPQERDLRIPRRFNLMPTYMRLAAAIAIVAVAGAAGLMLLNKGPGFGGTPTATPAPTPTPSPVPTLSQALRPLNPQAFVTYHSQLYGWEIGHPPELKAEPATIEWDFERDAGQFLALDAEESFIGGPDGAQVRISAWSVAAAPGATVDAWIEGYCTAQGEPCPNPRDLATTTEIFAEVRDQHPGLLVTAAGGATAFFLSADWIFVVRCWQSDDAPAVAIWGGCRPMVKAMAETMVLNVPEPTATTPPAS
jgi:hypothetical protein